jgi:FlgD Ig-like domain
VDRLRLLSTALLFILLGATAAAFVVTERLKLEPSPVTHVFVTKVFSPACECDTDLGVIAFRLRRADRVTLSIADHGRHTVRTLVGPVARRRGGFSASWDGRDADGAVVPDGVYHPLVHLRHRTILMPNVIRVDTTPPTVRLRGIAPRVLQPGKQLRVRYALNEPAHVDVFLDGKRIVVGHSTRPRWKVEWPSHGKPGVYHVTVAARDVAGNLSDATRPIVVVIPLRVVTRTVRTRPGRRFVVGIVPAGHRAYHWQLAKAAGFASARRLLVRAPKKAGRYALVIRQDGLTHRVRVTVTKRQSH